MSNRNIHQITEFAQLKVLVSNNLTVIIGFTCPGSTKDEKVMVKKFLKRKAELFPLIQFVYMELTGEQIETTKLDIIDKDYDSYPMIYHIRDGNKVLCEVKSADREDLYESFAAVSPYYKAEMEEFAKAAENAKNTKSSKGKSDKSSKGGSKKKKSKVTINVGQPTPAKNAEGNEDSESEIEMQQNVSDEQSDPKVDQNQLNAEMKATIEREKFYAIEDEFEDMQKILINEVKDRIIIEQREEEEEEKRESKKKSKSTDRGKKQPKQPERPQHDQIGTSSKGKNDNRRVRRRR